MRSPRFCGLSALATLLCLFIASSPVAFADKTEAQLLRALSSRKPSDVIKAMDDLLADFPTPEAAAKISSLVRDPRPDVRRRAAVVLGRMGGQVDEYTLEGIALMLTEPDKSVVIDVLRTLRELQATSTASKVLPLLAHTDATVKREACKTLTEIGDSSAIPSLEPLLNDPVKKVAKEAGVTIDALTGRAPTTGGPLTPGTDGIAPAGPSTSLADLSPGCEPDVSKIDPITKQANRVWFQALSTPSFGSSLFSTQGTSVYAVVGRYGRSNQINIEIHKREKSGAVASFESSLRGMKGKPFVFGFTNAEPISFTVTEVNNQTKVDQGFLASGEIVTTIVLLATVSDEDLVSIRKQLTTRRIDGVRVVLADTQMDRVVDDKSGRKLMQKFACFYQALDRSGALLTTAPPERGATGPSDSAREAVSQRRTDTQKSGTTLTNENVVQMVEAKLADDIIIVTIRNSSSSFDLSADGLTKLKKAGVSDAVIRAMIK